MRQARKRHYGPHHSSWLPYLLIAPSALCVLLILVYPLIKGILSGFVDQQLLVPNSTVFVGLKHYARLGRDEIFLSALRNNFIWVFAVVTTEFVIGLITAMLLNQDFPGRAIYRSLILIPWVVPSVAAALTWKWIYADQFGIFNYILRRIGLIDHDLSWLGNPALAFPSIIVAAIWKGIPFVTVVLLAGLQSIPKDLYEAAYIDGASGWQGFCHVTLPHLKAVGLIAFLLSCIWTFNDFDLAFIMTRGGPANATQLLSIYTYLTAFNFFNFNYAAAIAGIIFLILVIGTFFYVKALRMGETN